MLPSPLQLDDIRFVHVRVEPREAPDFREQFAEHPKHIFTNTRFNTTLEHTFAEDSEDQPMSNFLVTLRVELPDIGETPPPYLIDVKCVGYFSISKKVFPDEEKRVDVGVVNGASLLYGTIRDMVLSITSRAWYGPLLLPSMSFMDDGPRNGKYQAIPLDDSKAKPAKTAAKARSKKVVV
jgi:preprotein translocase subunit SecB